MSLSDWKLDHQTRFLVRKAIAKATRDQKRWLESWDRSQLLNLGYSKLVVAKAVELDLRQSWSFVIVFCFIITDSALLPWWAFVAFGFLVWTYEYYRYRKAKLSPADNRLVLEELTQKLGTDADEYIEHPVLESWSRHLGKRALLWRLDRFLSRKPSSG